MLKVLLELFLHKHQYKKIGFQRVGDSRSKRSIRHYKCQTCGNEKWVRGRWDN